MVGTQEERLLELNNLYPNWECHTLWSRFEINAKRFYDTEFLVFENVSYTYEETLEWVNHTADSLWNLGVRPSTHVAVMLHNCPEYIFLIFALSKLGAVKVPLNVHMKDCELQYVLNHSDSSVLISEHTISELVLNQIPQLKKVVVKTANSFMEDNRQISWNRFITCKKTQFLFDEIIQNPDSLSDIIFTSGSTSTPKGVMVHHDMLWRNAYSSCYCRRMEIGRRMFVPIPLFHAFAYVEGLLAMVLMGGTVIMLEEKFTPEHALEMMKRHRANDIICVSLIMMNLLMKGNIKSEEFKDMHAAYWASTCPKWVWNAGKEAFGISDVVTSYGMTECGSTVSMLTPMDPPEYVSKCNGKVKPGGSTTAAENSQVLFETKICDVTTGEQLDVGQAGELCCRGKSVTRGYYNNSEANEKAFDSEGWFHTGDICVFDENGYMTFIGRNNDMYKINGENVSPQFLDQVIGRCPLVRAVETVGIPSERCGEVGVAFIDAEQPGAWTEAEIRLYCKEHLAGFQIPKHIIFLRQEQFPRTGSGKVPKYKLKKLAEEILYEEKREG